MKFVFCILLALALLTGSAAQSGKKLIQISPSSAAVDQGVAIKITGLTPRAQVVIFANQDRFGFPLQSKIIVGADSQGVVDLTRVAPHSGDYTEIDPMGLFWSMKLVGKPRDFDFQPGVELRPYDITVSVYHSGTKVASTIEHRYVVAASIKHSVIRSHGVIADFFAPRDGLKHPAVIVLNGSDGGLQSDTAALLARHGYCTLALAYFGIGLLPRYLARVPVETVDRALKTLKAMPNVDRDRIGIVGFSKGAELALLAASRNPAIRAVVAYAPASAVFEGLSDSRIPESSWTLGGKPLPFANGTIPKSVQAKLARSRAEGVPVAYEPWYRAKLNGATTQAAIRVESINGPVMLIAGGDDHLWPSGYMAEQIARRLREHEHPFADQVLIYPRAGHAIEVPFVPTAHTVVAGDLALGGSALANAQADAQSWVQVLRFLDSSLLLRRESSA